VSVISVITEIKYVEDAAASSTLPIGAAGGVERPD
jgi:hypothetical protein